MRPINTDEAIPTTAATATSAAAPQPRSPWHSPVPYLFGGLAAMLGLIAFALLILACSYWRLSGHLDNENGERDIESGGNEKEGSEGKVGGERVYEEKILVIMAGNQKPTFLATPVCTKVSSFNGKSKAFECSNEVGDRETEPFEKVKDGEIMSDEHAVVVQTSTNVTTAEEEEEQGINRVAQSDTSHQ